MTVHQNAPVVFFAYRRPNHTRRALESLAQNHGAAETQLFIFCEAAKGLKDQEGVQQVRALVRSQQWCGKVKIIERESNLGCANSIIAGVTEICAQYGRVIVVEDDLVLSPYFLNYMNQALDLYENYDQVMQISGYMFPVNLDSRKETVFLPFIISWGWATWQRAWQHFDPTMSAYTKLKSDEKLRYQFDLNGSRSLFQMLEAQRRGEIDAWDIRWYLSVFMLSGLVLYPTKSLVSNIGFDGSGTHYRSKSSESRENNPHSISSNSTNLTACALPEATIADLEAMAILHEYFIKQNKRVLTWERLTSKIGKLLTREKWQSG